jgi:hypothetical protein
LLKEMRGLDDAATSDCWLLQGCDGLTGPTGFNGMVRMMPAIVGK